MSLNQLLLNEEKPYMNIRVNNCEVDGDQLGREVQGNLTWSGVIAGTSAYKATILGNVCVLRINAFNPVASGSGLAQATLPEALRPSDSERAEGVIMVEDNGFRVLGNYIILPGGQLDIGTINPANNRNANFSGSGTTGWARALVLIYTIDQ